MGGYNNIKFFGYSHPKISKYESEYGYFAFEQIRSIKGFTADIAANQVKAAVTHTYNVMKQALNVQHYIENSMFKNRKYNLTGSLGGAIYVGGEIVRVYNRLKGESKGKYVTKNDPVEYALSRTTRPLIYLPNDNPPIEEWKEYITARYGLRGNEYVKEVLENFTSRTGGIEVLMIYAMPYADYLNRVLHLGGEEGMLYAAKKFFNNRVSKYISRIKVGHGMFAPNL